jgi:hypothetical protein
MHGVPSAEVLPRGTLWTARAEHVSDLLCAELEQGLEETSRRTNEAGFIKIAWAKWALPTDAVKAQALRR